MSRVITFSRYFPVYHPRKGEPTYFVEKLFNDFYGPYDWSELIGWESRRYIQLNTNITDFKHHTIRAGNRFKVGDKFSPRVWSGKPYNSKQIIIAPDIEIKKVWNIELQIDPFLLIDDCIYTIKINNDYISKEKTPSIINDLAKNDGLSYEDFVSWFIQSPKAEVFYGQIICWNENINY